MILLNYIIFILLLLIIAIGQFPVYINDIFSGYNHSKGKHYFTFFNILLIEKTKLEPIFFYILALFVTLLTVLLAWFWWIVFRAYQYMRDGVQEGI